MSKTTSTLEIDDALALWNWAWAELEQPVDFDFVVWRSRGEFAESVLDVLSFVACELSLAGRHEWIERLPDMLKMHRGWLMFEASAQDKCTNAVADLLHRGAPVTKAVRAMARAADPRVRAVVASNLQLADPDARAVLETLATDSNREVRKIARRRLPPRQPSAWWVGKFESDPIPRLSEANDEVIAALRTVALFADRDEVEQQEAMLPQLVEALALLPTPILIEFVKRFVVFDWLAPGYAPMLDELLRRPSGASALWNMLVARLDRPHGWPHHWLLLQKFCDKFSSEAREQLCAGFLQCLVEHRQSRRARDMAHIVGGVLRDCWPASLEPVLVLDAWESLARDTPKVAEHLLPLLSKERIDLRAQLHRLLPLAERDKDLVRALTAAVSRLDPDARHAFIVRGLASESDKVRALALEQLVTLPPDPAVGSGQVAFTRYWNEPALRRAIVSDRRLCEAFCPYLRRQLRAGALELSEVAATLQAVGRLWGGTHRTDDKRAARLEQAAAWHEDASETGPPTEQEWAAWRAQRRELLDSKPKVHAPSLLAVRPAGGLHPDDREVIDELVARWRQRWSEVSATPDRHDEVMIETVGLCFTICEIEEPYVLELLEQILAAIRVLDHSVVDMIENQVQQLRRALATEGG